MIRAASSYSAVRHLASAVFTLSDTDKYMLMLNAFFDETGSEDDPNIFVAGMAGCMVSAGLWERFEIEWLAVLDAYGVDSPFHMKDFAHSVKQFADWKGDQTRRDEFCNRLWDVLAELDPYFIGCLMPLKPYREVLSAKQRKDLMGVYQQTYVSCVATIFQLVQRGIYGTLPKRVQMIFEYRQGVMKDVVGIYEGMMKVTNYHYKDIILPPILQPKSSLVPLQAADILAYECHKELRRRLYHRDEKVRLGFQRLQKILNKQFGDKVKIGDRGSPIIFHPVSFPADILKRWDREVLKLKNERTAGKTKE